VACIIFSFLALKWLKSYTNHGTFVEVPNLVGLSLDDAETTLQNFDLRTQVQDSSNYNPKYPSGAVVEQEPFAGAQSQRKQKNIFDFKPIRL
jgi:beta-lactam-binding protein with PASTA domain